MKKHADANSLGGMGSGLLVAYSENFIMVFTMLEVDSNDTYRSGSKGFTSFRKI